MRQNSGFATGIAGMLFAVTAGAQAPQRDGANQGVVPPAPAAGATRRNTETPLRGTPASRAPANISWGPGHIVQAGVAMYNRYGSPNQHTGLYVFGVYLRNVAKSTLTVRCPSFDGLSVPSDATGYTTLIQSFSTFSTPHIRDSKGKPVPVTYKLGTDEKSVTLRPGEVVMVSHWMLRAMRSGTRKAEGWSYDLVAFGTTGTYRVGCDVKVAWSDGDEAHSLLHTGEAKIEVTNDDLAY